MAQAELTSQELRMICNALYQFEDKLRDDRANRVADRVKELYTRLEDIED